MKLLITGARLLSRADGLDTVGDLLIENGKIAAIGTELSQERIDRTVPARGLVLTAGMVDLFAHAAEPAGPGEEDPLSLGAAAVAGGFTGVCIHTGAKTAAETEHLRERAGYAACDLYPSVCAVSGKELLPFGELKLAGARAVYEDDGVDNPLRMRDALFRAKKYGIPVLSRCRDRRMYTEGVIREGTMAGLLEMSFIPASAEAIAVARDLVLAREAGAGIHLGHISTAASVELIRIAKSLGVAVTASVEPEYLLLSSAALRGWNTLAKLDPPLGNPEDVTALRAAVRDGVIDCIASGHRPVPMALKRKSMQTAADGASSLETALAAALTALYHSGLMPLDRVLEALTSAPAAVLHTQGGHVRVGDDADLLLLDPDAEWAVHGAEFVSMGKNTPLEGMSLRGRPVYTLKAGRIAFEGK
ncbi:MAG: amidohydrolase family protein [Clostridiaceae bacterium]|nr:amidohydrolase family protein [Clostridiaceae bacterium]